jgi:hypothetical protein
MELSTLSTYCTAVLSYDDCDDDLFDDHMFLCNAKARIIIIIIIMNGSF